MSYTCANDVSWTIIMALTNPTVLDRHIALIILFLNDNKINSVILD